MTISLLSLNNFEVINTLIFTQIRRQEVSSVYDGIISTTAVLFEQCRLDTKTITDQKSMKVLEVHVS